MKLKKNLQRLLENIPHTHLSGPDPADIEVTAVTVDSREAAGDGCFVAVAGSRDDGHSFIGDAVRGGCSAIIVEQGKFAAAECDEADVCVLGVDDTRAAVGEIASAFYDRPEKQITVIGVTGTNGKTTVSYLLETILVDQGYRVGVIGTVNYRYIDDDGNSLLLPAPYTTPEPLLLERLLRQMVDAGVDTVVMEVSSHALAQRRLGRLAFDVAVFTNLSQDHLDYHRTMESYFQAKTLLFLSHLKKVGAAVISHGGGEESPAGSWPRLLSAILQQNNIRVFASGRSEKSVIEPLSISIDTSGTHLSLGTPGGTYDVSSPLVGDFNAANIMTAMAVSMALHLDMARTVASLEKDTGAPGRLEKITLGTTIETEAAVFVDYAHTPDALLNVLTTLRGLPHERLICVFGCGGDRDRGKRAVMGTIAARNADIVIVTADNPRTESNDQIIDDIMEGMRLENGEERQQNWFLSSGAQTGFVVIADRREAIHAAVACAGVKDVVVIAGKGHEKYQITNTGRRFFDDALEVREAMLAWDVKSVAAAVKPLSFDGSDVRAFAGISTDTRSLRRNDLFVALRGESFDGHVYVPLALEKGAAGVIVEKGVVPPGTFTAAEAAFFEVEDTLKALGDLAHYRQKIVRKISAPVVVAVTGSTGKTTVKEMVAAIFACRWPDTPSAPAERVLKTMGNFNNLIGLPLCLLPIELKHRAAVLELGMNRQGEIARLTEIADPDIACILNVHGAHLEGLGSIEGVAREKAALFAGTSRTGVLVVNLDDRHVREAAAACPHRTTVSWTVEKERNDHADVAAFALTCGDDGTIAFRLQIGERTVDVELQVPGRHNVANAAAAAAIAHAAGIAAETIATGLQSFSSASKRLQIVPATGGYTILDDTYNANPASMAAGLAALADMGEGSKVAVLGTMLELGQASEAAHRQVGETAASIGLVRLAVVGDYAAHMADAAIAAGMNEDKVMVFSSKDDIPAWIHKLQAEGVLSEASWVLIKASRGLRLESVVERLAEEQAT